MVIADASPLNYLVLIGHANVLATLYRQVLVPAAVWSELQHPETPTPVLAWTAAPPSWLKIDPVPDPGSKDRLLIELDAGERAVIALAEAHETEVLLLMDDLKGRAEAQRRGIGVVGTLGILRDAASAGLLDLADAFERLRRTSFRASPELMNAVLRKQALQK